MRLSFCLFHFLKSYRFTGLYGHGVHRQYDVSAVTDANLRLRGVVDNGFIRTYNELSLRHLVIVDFNVGGIPNAIKAADLIQKLVKQLPVVIAVEFRAMPPDIKQHMLVFAVKPAMKFSAHSKAFL